MKIKSRTIKKTPYIFKCMDISTAHITEKDNKLLSKKKDNPVIFYKYRYGYFITVPYLQTIPEIKKKYKDFKYSREFIDIIIQAIKLKCEYLLIDADGHLYSDIPTYNW